MTLVNRIIDFIASNPGMTAIAWLATVIGVILTTVIPIIQRKKKRLSFQYTTTQLVEAEVAKANNIQVLFKGRPIEKLSVTKFVIKNTGNTTVKAEHMYDGHKLKIIAPNVKLISVDVEKVSRDIVTDEKKMKPLYHAKDTERLDIKDLNKVKPDDEYGLIPIDFKVFEKKDFMILNIYHTGNSDTPFCLAGIGEELQIVNETKDNTELMKSVEAIGYISGYRVGRLLVYIEKWLNNK